ncbi:MAG: hypothetical protein AB8B85_00670 [Paracoccaceae bacterium]
MTDFIFLAIGFIGLGALATVLAIIGKAAGACPEIGAAARVGTWVVTTGFCAIGVGVIALVGAALSALMEGRGDGLYLAVGCVAIALGVGFTYAAGTLRGILQAAPRSMAPRDALAQAAAP